MIKFLKEHGIVVPDDQVFRLAIAANKAVMMAKETLFQNAEGKYLKHPSEAGFPPWPEVEPTLNCSTRALSVKNDWEAYKKESALSTATDKAWRPMLEKLAKFLNSDNVSRMTPEQAV